MESPPRSSRRTRVPPPPTGIHRRSGPPVPPFIILAILIPAVIAIFAAGFYLVTAKSVSIVVGGVKQSVRTYQPTVGALLADLQLLVEPEDTVTPPRETQVRSGLLITIDKAFPVVIEADGQRRRVLTHLMQPREILAEAKVVLGPNDALSVDGAAPARDFPADVQVPRHILVLRAITVSLQDGDKATTLHSVRTTVGEVLAEAGVPLFLADSVMPDPDTALTDGMTITIKRSLAVTIDVDGRTLGTRTHGKTVGEALAEAGIALVGLDYAQPAESEPVAAGIKIRVVRVTEEDAVERTEIDFKKSTQPDQTLPLDEKKVIQPGVKGIQERRVRIRREDGREVSRSAPQIAIVQQAKDEIVAVGTQIVLKNVNTPNGVIQYWRQVKMRAASYKPSSTGKSLDDPTYGITATGEKLRKGIVAVDPKIIPLGTKLFIPGYGLATAADTGGAVNGLVIDLGYSDTDYKEWHEAVDVYILAPAPPPDQIPPLPVDSDITS